MTATARRPQMQKLDWAAMARRRGEIYAQLCHTQPDMSVPVRDAEAMRILCTEAGSLVIPRAISKYEAETVQLVADEQKRAMKQEFEVAHAEYKQAAGRIRQDLAAAIRRWADDPQKVRGKLKREGVLLAAEWVDPS